MIYNQATLREFGDNQHLIVYVEIDHLAYQIVKQIKRITQQVPYRNLKNKGKVIGQDFYFSYKNYQDKKDICLRLKKLLGVSLGK